MYTERKIKEVVKGIFSLATEEGCRKLGEVIGEMRGEQIQKGYGRFEYGGVEVNRKRYIRLQILEGISQEENRGPYLEAFVGKVKGRTYVDHGKILEDIKGVLQTFKSSDVAVGLLKTAYVGTNTDLPQKSAEDILFSFAESDKVSDRQLEEVVATIRDAVGSRGVKGIFKSLDERSKQAEEGLEQAIGLVERDGALIQNVLKNVGEEIDKIYKVTGKLSDSVRTKDAILPCTFLVGEERRRIGYSLEEICESLGLTTDRRSSMWSQAFARANSAISEAAAEVTNVQKAYGRILKASVNVAEATHATAFQQTPARIPRTGGHDASRGFAGETG